MDDIRTTAVKYIKSLSSNDRLALKNNVKNEVTCCVDYAKSKGINIKAFNDELFAIFSED